MKKITTLIAIAIALTVSIVSPVQAAGDPSASVHVSPVSYEDWRDEGNSFRGGFELFSFFFSKLSPESRAQYVEEGELDVLKTFGEFELDDLLREFKEEIWTNGEGYSYTIRK